jgi:D-alanine transaminase
MDVCDVTGGWNGGVLVSQLIWFNGETNSLRRRALSVEDRGYQFADGVYEVVRFYNGKPFTLQEHTARLQRSAEGIKLSLPMDAGTIGEEIRKFIPKTGIRKARIYLQLTRGVADRNHKFPTPQTHTLLFYARPLPPLHEPGEGRGDQAAGDGGRAVEALLDQVHRADRQHPRQERSARPRLRRARRSSIAMS